MRCRLLWRIRQDIRWDKRKEFSLYFFFCFCFFFVFLFLFLFLFLFCFCFFFCFLFFFLFFVFLFLFWFILDGAVKIIILSLYFNSNVTNDYSLFV